MSDNRERGRIGAQRVMNRLDLRASFGPKPCTRPKAISHSRAAKVRKFAGIQVFDMAAAHEHASAGPALLADHAQDGHSAGLEESDFATGGLFIGSFEDTTLIKIAFFQWKM
ncbi:hypothetical protein [Sinorhizobium mexicanum]|uniref:Uncharacterized protein n=1 Tax=Sinorhizobium mexicanum TaxID=375549 RepID=A0A859QJJ8_9HYPH|nr:hypothetical protein [Sinorhizobium mexicanum]MBP1887559.1 hypothetical protein [Sinorhizobium mexicanum]QLL63305.1 hypothetical protein FKV68_18565 [Sinorhizobium mexicanum]